jgi:hypothetical protein
VVAEIFGSDDVEVSGLESIGQMDEDADLERTPAENDTPLSAFGDKVLPPWRGETEIKFLDQIVAACMTPLDDDCESV